MSGNKPNELVQGRMRRRGVPQARSGAVGKVGIKEYIRG